MNGSYMIYRRNSSGIRDTLIERYTSFSISLNWGELSKFSISGKTIGEVQLKPGDGLCFYRNLEKFFCGVVTKLTVTCSDVNAGYKEWTAEGSEDSVIFSRWQVFADPVSITFANDVVDTYTAYAHNRQLYYIRRNMGSDALSYRQLPGLTLPANQSRGQRTQSAYRYKALNQVLEEIGAETDGNGVVNALFPRYVWDPDTGARSVEIPSQRDMTNVITIAPEFGNVIDWEKESELPTCNAVWVCSGDADDGTRRYVYLTDEDSIRAYGRFEKVVTKSDIKVTAGDADHPAVTAAEVDTLLANEARKELTEGAYREKFTGVMVETPELQFMTDWRCGDLVTAVIDGVSFVTTIKTVEIEYANGYEQVTPTLGEVEHGIFSEIFKRLKGLDTRMINKELS